MIESRVVKPGIRWTALSSYAAGVTGILANLFLIAFYALQASQPENGTWLGQRSGRFGFDGVDDPRRAHVGFCPSSSVFRCSRSSCSPPEGYATLFAVYFGVVTATQAIFQTLTGQQKLPQVVIVASTLLIAALFNPLRRRIQDVVDKCFYRRKYDARETLEAFSARLRDETDLESLNNELVRVVRETMQPKHVFLWLRASGDRQAN